MYLRIYKMVDSNRYFLIAITLTLIFVGLFSGFNAYFYSDIKYKIESGVQVVGITESQASNMLILNIVVVIFSVICLMYLAYSGFKTLSDSIKSENISVKEIEQSQIKLQKTEQKIEDMIEKVKQEIADIKDTDTNPKSLKVSKITDEEENLPLPPVQIQAPYVKQSKKESVKNLVEPVKQQPARPIRQQPAPKQQPIQKKPERNQQMNQRQQPQQKPPMQQGKFVQKQRAELPVAREISEKRVPHLKRSARKSSARAVEPPVADVESEDQTENEVDVDEVDVSSPSTSSSSSTSTSSSTSEDVDDEISVEDRPRILSGSGPRSSRSFRSSRN